MDIKKSRSLIRENRNPGIAEFFMDIKIDFLISGLKLLSTFSAKLTSLNGIISETRPLTCYNISPWIWYIDTWKWNRDDYCRYLLCYQSTNNFERGKFVPTHFFYYRGWKEWHQYYHLISHCLEDEIIIDKLLIQLWHPNPA